MPYPSLYRFLLMIAFASLTACQGPIYERNTVQLSERGDGQLQAQAPADCPKWKDAQLANYSNSVMANFGCAHAKNFAAMVDDPADFLGSRSTANPDATRNAQVIETYQSGSSAGSDADSNEGE